MSESEQASRLELARAVAREAGRHTLRYYRQANLAVELKSDRSPVTVADREAEQLLRRRIAEAFPQDAILGEEFGETAGTSGYRWILDPIDGTKSFVHGVPLFGTMVAVEFGKRGVIGVVVLPALDEVVYAARGMGAWLERGQAAAEPVRVSGETRLAQGLVCSSSWEPVGTPAQIEGLRRASAAARIGRTWGDCFGYLLVATGRAEAMVDPLMNVWDTAAVQPIIEEAGGRFTDWRGNDTMYAAEAVASNGKVHAELLRHLAGE